MYQVPSSWIWKLFSPCTINITVLFSWRLVTSESVACTLNNTTQARTTVYPHLIIETTLFKTSSLLNHQTFSCFSMHELLHEYFLKIYLFRNFLLLKITYSDNLFPSVVMERRTIIWRYFLPLVSNLTIYKFPKIYHTHIFSRYCELCVVFAFNCKMHPVKFWV